jgi:hypothetical protein
MAQEQLSFPFQGGKEAMNQFFKDSLAVSPEVVQKKATGLVVFKFSADTKGNISKLVVYYAEDPLLVPPVFDALKKSNHKWIIPDHEKIHDFLISFAFHFNPPATGIIKLQKAVYNNYRNRIPIFSTDQVPLDVATLLPTVMVNYDLAGD